MRASSGLVGAMGESADPGPDDRVSTGEGIAGSLVDFLYPRPARRNALSILGWWERRRLPYNLAVGVAGTFSLAYGMVIGFVPLQAPVLVPVAVFAALANVCYLFGPAVEILLHKLFGRDLLPTGPALYRMGLTFSVGLALFPALLMTFGWVLRAVFGPF